MELQKINPFCLHNDCIQKFNNKLYSDILSIENVRSKQKAIVFKKEKYYGYYLEKGKDNFFMPEQHYNQLPFKIKKEQIIDYKGDVLRFIIEVETINIPSEKRMSFKDLVDITPNFSHTNPLHFKLYKIIALTSYIDRINTRVSTDAGFGKDSVVNIIHELVDSTLNIYGATFAKLEYSLTNKLIILNEMGNLKKDEKMDMQEFLLATGAMFNTYNKRTRKTSSTQEQYNISRLSLLIFYNLPSYYTGKAQEYFDQMFTKAVINRFIPFVFEGTLTTKFEKILDIEKIMLENEHAYKDIIATLTYFRENNIKSIKYDIPKEIYFPEHLKRYERTFLVIAKYISNYSDSKEDFNSLITELYNCYRRYETLLITEKEIL